MDCWVEGPIEEAGLHEVNYDKLEEERALGQERELLLPEPHLHVGLNGLLLQKLFRVSH